MDTDSGRSPSGSGSSPAGRAASAGVSPVPASIPNADDDDTQVTCSFRDIYDFLSRAARRAQRDSEACQKAGNSNGAVFLHGCSQAYGSVSEAFEALQVTGSFANSDLAQELEPPEGAGA
jgi:predicted esterase